METLHATQVKKLRKELGVRALDSNTLHAKGKELFKDKFLGVLSQDSPFPTKDGYTIMNNDYVGGAGIHWVAVIKKGKHIYVYDSFGRYSKNILPTFTTKMTTKGYTIHSADPSDADQFGYTSVDCGHRSLSALQIANSKGVNAFMML